MNGIVKKLVKDRKFGFINGENNQEYFFHQSALKNAEFDALTEGRELTFKESKGTKGPRAEEIYLK